VDRESLDCGNDSVLNDPLLGQCRHGKRWDMCEMAACREIWQLYQKQWKDHRRDVKDWQNAYFVEKRRKRGIKSQYEIALEQKQNKRVISSDDDGIEGANADEQTDPIPAGGKKLFRYIFPDKITLQAAVQFKAVTLRQGQVLKGYFDSDEALPISKRWAAIGKKIGFSGKTVEREFQTLVGKFLKTRDSPGEPRAAIEAVHVRGERRPRYYRKHSLQFGEWKRGWTELITDRKIIRELREKSTPMIRSDKTPIPSSSVNRLFAALIRQFASDLPKDERVCPKDVSASDWEFNLRRAQRLLAGKRHLTGPWTASEVAKKLVRGGRLCGACRTFLIRGFRINGRRITRAREYCDDACKMRAERRKNRIGAVNLSNRAP
jgi:hypothetical protein